MKYLLLLTVVLVAVWVWRHNRRDSGSDQTPRRSASPVLPTTRMMACAQCGMHLPEQEAVTGRLGTYCCDEHRRQREDA